MNNGIVETKKSPRGNTLVKFEVDGMALSIYINLQTKEVEVFGVEAGVNGYELFQRMEDHITAELDLTRSRAETFSSKTLWLASLNAQRQNQLKASLEYLQELKAQVYTPVKNVA